MLVDLLKMISTCIIGELVELYGWSSVNVCMCVWYVLYLMINRKDGNDVINIRIFIFHYLWHNSWEMIEIIPTTLKFINEMSDCDGVIIFDLWEFFELKSMIVKFMYFIWNG